MPHLVQSPPRLRVFRAVLAHECGEIAHPARSDARDLFPGAVEHVQFLGAVGGVPDPDPELSSFVSGVISYPIGNPVRIYRATSHLPEIGLYTISVRFIEEYIFLYGYMTKYE